MSPPSRKRIIPDDKSGRNFQNTAILINLTTGKSKIMLLTNTEAAHKDTAEL
jgi:hypothetical protein